jgi:hypothetical protein
MVDTACDQHWYSGYKKLNLRSNFLLESMAGFDIPLSQGGVKPGMDLPIYLG